MICCFLVFIFYLIMHNIKLKVIFLIIYLKYNKQQLRLYFVFIEGIFHFTLISYYYNTYVKFWYIYTYTQAELHITNVYAKYIFMTIQKFIHIYNLIENIRIFVCSLQFGVVIKKYICQKYKDAKNTVLKFGKIVLCPVKNIVKGTVKLKMSVFQEKHLDNVREREGGNIMKTI